MQEKVQWLIPLFGLFSIYEIAARFHVTSRFAGLSNQLSQNTPCCAEGEWLISGGLGG